MKQLVNPNFFHELPKDMLSAINSSEQVKSAWENITPLARNEWICWTTNVKQNKTRLEHIERMKQDLARGKRRPCCWVGCIHRTDKKPGAWAQKVLIDKVKLN
jgi:uncharacterized protein YdeI (YjbR/CyaY-like superfamily)